MTTPVSAPHWLMDSRLACSRWLTHQVYAAMQFKTRRVSRPLREVAEKIASFSLQKRFGSNGYDLNDVSQAVDDGDEVWRRRYEDIITPLLSRTSAVDLPPAAIVTHNGSAIPYLAKFSDGGQLVLVDPATHLLVHAIGAAATNYAYNHSTLTSDVKKELTDFIISTAASYKSVRAIVRARFGSETWQKWALRVIHLDVDLLPVAEGVAANALAFSIYHEFAHSLLGHSAHGRVEKYSLDGDSRSVEVAHWRKDQEFQADSDAAQTFLKLQSTRSERKFLPASPYFESSPLVLFSVLELVWKVRAKLGEGSDVETHPSPHQRLEALRTKFGEGISKEGAEILEAVEFSLGDVSDIVERADFIQRERFPS